MRENKARQRLENASPDGKEGITHESEDRKDTICHGMGNVGMSGSVPDSDPTCPNPI